MFKRYPYTGWLLLSLLFWSLAIFRYMSEQSELKPEPMAQTVQEALHDKELGFQRLLADSQLIKSIFSESLREKQVIALTKLPYYVYAYEGATLKFWNNNKLLADCTQPGTGRHGTLLFNDRGVFVRKCITPSYLDSNQQLVALFPVQVRFPIENSYLHSHFVGAAFVPLSTKITANPMEGRYTVRSIDGEPAFYLLFSGNDLPSWIPDHPMIALLLLALLSSIMWLQVFTIYLTRKRSFHVGFIITLLVIVGTRYLTYAFGYPFNLESLPLFSPQLYASSGFLPSLGDLLLNALCFLWLVVFVIRHTPYNIFRQYPIKNVFLRVLLALIFTYLLVGYSFEFTNVIRSLVLDSRISFDVSHFYSISRYTIAGLFTIGIVTAASCLMVFLFNAQLTHLVGSKWLKYLLIAATGYLLITLQQEPGAENIRFLYVLTAWLVLFAFLLDRKSLAHNFDIFSPHTIFWAVFICGFCTGILQYFNFVNEKEERKRFAEAIVQQRDDIMAYAFRGIARNISSDKAIKDYFIYPAQTKRQAINERFDALYLGGHLNRYQSKVLLFNANKKPLHNSDTLSFQHLQEMVSHAEPVTDSTLYYREDALDGHYYLGYIPIPGYDDSSVLGYVFIDFTVKESGGESVYPELLQPGSVKGSQNAAGYSYGIYVNNRLITQTRDYAFPVYLHTQIETGSYLFYHWRVLSELYYKPDDNKTVLVVRSHRMWLESITLFSYLFGMQMLIVLMVLLYRLLLSWLTSYRGNVNLINLTLRRRIHLSMLGIVLVSFLLIGLVTIVYSILLYKQSTRKKLELVMQLVERSTQQYLKGKNAFEDVAGFENELSQSGFKYFITTLSDAQKIDINIFDAKGELKVTSQENIYDKSLLARIMETDAHYMLFYLNRSIHIQEERVGRLSYVSCYVPLWSDSGQLLGFLNIPYFSSQKELSFQISNILVALINLYAFIFLISSLLTVFITKWLTRTLSIVISRFERLTLSRNELIDWPYDDEIGLLVKEYNKMVRKVEENAVLLAQSERESAWREMAQQVAHEIKNPLTPMKLNIQYLQQALRNDNPNIKELTKKVAESLIEQIDNLSYIASEFSNFAKMPEAKPEVIELNEVLSRLTELYLNEENIKVSFVPFELQLHVYVDRSQLLRILTNLVENAVQAIPEERTGKIILSLSRDDENATIACKDNGIGIAADVVDKIFHPYFTTKTSGTGLGLAMTRKMIEFWQGSIWFETEENKGTTFFIKLPLHQD